MRTPAWRASNAPIGPGARIRCSCGSVLVELEPGQQITRDRGVAARVLTCDSCGHDTRARISDASSASHQRTTA